MIEHVELEVSLEIIMAEIAKEIFNMSGEENSRFMQLIEVQERAYKGDRQVISKILSKEI